MVYDAGGAGRELLGSIRSKYAELGLPRAPRKGFGCAAPLASMRSQMPPLNL